MSNALVLRNKLGTFIFDQATPLSLAKLVRDTVTGQWFSPRPGSFRLRNEMDCVVYIRDQASDVIAYIPFSVEIGN